MRTKINRFMEFCKKTLAVLLAAVMVFCSIPVVMFADNGSTETISNDYIKVVVSKVNGGYTIATLDGDILKKSDNNKELTHRGDNFDTSFTAFQVNDSAAEEYIFGNNYGFLGLNSSSVTTEIDMMGITSTWSVKELEIVQRIELVSGEMSEQLGMALISYTVTNKSAAAKNVKSRILMDTRMGENDFGYYEVTKSALGAGYSFIDRETTLSGTDVSADYFVKDAPFGSEIAAFGVNSALSTERPYQMTFAHWANIASTKFNYIADNSLYFVNSMNPHHTADSAVGLYYDLGSIPAGAERTFSTFYGVTANLKNKDNKVTVNTTAPTKLEFNETRTAFIGTSGQADNRVRISTTVSNPAEYGKSYKNLAVAIYAIGFTCQRQTDSGKWIKYNNEEPLRTDIVDFTPGQSRPTFFDFEFEPRDNHELGSFVTRVFNMDPAVNELGVYADEFCLGETTNYIFIPAKDPTLPSITLHNLEPTVLYNDARRFITVTGSGMSFFATALSSIELRGEHRTYQIPIKNMTISQDARSISLLLDEYMETGRYQLTFLWDGNQPDDIPNVFTSSAMYVHLTDDELFRNDAYGIVTVSTDGHRHWVDSYIDEKEYETLTKQTPEGDSILFTLRGDLIAATDGKSFRLGGKDNKVNINHILQYEGDDFSIVEEDGSVKIEMDGKVTTIGANTTVRNGTSLFDMRVGKKYVIPVYNSRGGLVSGNSLRSNEEYLQLKWGDSADILQTIGGFLVDLQFGVMGKIQDEKDSKILYDIISFGGALDLSFMTPGGAAVARENQSKNASWVIEKEKTYVKPYVGWGTGGEGKTPVVEHAPTTSPVTDVEIGANVHNILFGQNASKTGYLGINMDAHIQMPQIVSFLPSKLAGSLAINTIGGYNVGIEGRAKTTTFNMAFALVVKSNPSGAPIPDKLYFSIGGFEPGVNVDGLGIFWVTGGGGGFDNLYETIYGTDGIPPFKLLLNVQFDIFKIMTGAADLGLSLRSFSISLSNVSLKMVKNARFIDSGYVGATWYPNFDLNVSASVNFLQVFKGRFSLMANEELFEMMLRIALSIPEFIPIIGGMELASAELGGGTEKMWGRVAILGIGLGFTYWWDSGDIDFSTGRGASARTAAVFNIMTAPQEVGTDPKTGDKQYLSVGSNLSYVSGSVRDPGLTAARIADAKKAAQLGKALRTLSFVGTPTTVLANSDSTQHLVTFGEPAGDYILTVSRIDGEPLGVDFKNKIKVSNNGAVYPLKFYEQTGYVKGLAPGVSLTEAEKEIVTNAVNNANVNVVDKVAYIAIPRSEQLNNPLFVLEFLDEIGYDVGAVFVEPIGTIKSSAASLTSGGKLQVSWIGENLDGTETISVSISDEPESDGIVLAEGISAAEGSGIEIDIPDNVASGEYTVFITLIDEEKCYDKYAASGMITITDVKAPGAPVGVTLLNVGNNKMSVLITDDNIDKSKLEGYYMDVYEDEKLIEAALFYTKEQAENGEILIGGRYDVPVMEEYEDDAGDIRQRQVTDENGEGIYNTLGFTPGKQYSVKVRAGGSESNEHGEALYHYSRYVLSDSVTLLAATPPILEILAEGWSQVNDDGIGFVTANTVSTVKLTANEPIKGTLTVGGGQGETYEFDDGYRAEWIKELTLPDGIHSMEFVAEDAQGNRSVFQTTVSVDTAEPVLMLESPVNGGIYTNNSVEFKGVVESDALYTFMLDGELIGESGRDMSAHITNGILEYSLALPGSERRHMIEIIATDRAGNVTARRMEVSDQNLPEIVRVSVYQNGEPVGTNAIALSTVGDAADLRLMGITKTNDVIDITEFDNVSFAVASGSAVILDRNIVQAASSGSSIVMASMDLGGDFMLNDAVAVTVDEDGEDDSDAFELIVFEENGTINAVVYNNTLITQATSIIAALYNESGVLVDIKAEAMHVESSGNKSATFVMNLSGERSGYSYKVFVWDSVTMIPLCEPFFRRLE